MPVESAAIKIRNEIQLIVKITLSLSEKLHSYLLDQAKTLAILNLFLEQE